MDPELRLFYQYFHNCLLFCSHSVEADSIFLTSNDISHFPLRLCLPAFWSIALFTGPCFLWEALFRLSCHLGNWLDSPAHWQTVAFVFTVLDHWARRGREKVYSLLSPVRLFSLCGILLATSCMEPFQTRGCLCFGKRHRLVLHIAQLLYQTQILLTVSLCFLMCEERWMFQLSLIFPQKPLISVHL